MPCLNAQGTEFAYLRRKKTATYLGISESQLDKLFRLGMGPLRVTLPGCRIPVYPLAALHGWVEQQKGQTINGI